MCKSMLEKVVKDDVVEQPVYKSEILKGFQAIGRAMGYGEDSAKRWEKEGAPIYRGDDNVPRAERMELWNWLKRNSE